VTAAVPVRPAVVRGDDLAQLRRWVTDIERWPEGSHRWGHYAERTAAGTAICRTENVSACHPGIAAVVRGPLAALAASAAGSAVVDFKDKINYKQPGGAGFRPHQDLPAYPGATRVVSILLAVDECSQSSGCLWLAPGVDEVLATDDRGVVSTEAAAALAWSPAELAPGDAVCIDGLAPHYSEANRSDSPRRVLVASFAPAGEGYGRDGYYAARDRHMEEATARDQRFRISTLADFDGVEVDGAAGPAERCWHPAARGTGPRSDKIST